MVGKPSTSTAPTDAGRHGFVAREWVDERVGAWLAGDEPVLVLSGPPGTGKTEFARHLAHARPELVRVHFCRARDDATLEPVRFVADLAQALAAKVDGYAGRVATPEAAVPAIVQGNVAAGGDIHGVATGVYMPVSLGELSARRAFDRVVRRPLEALASAGRCPRALLVIVDALDEALTLGPGETLVQLMQSILSPRPPVPLRLLLTTRRDPRVLGSLAAPRLDLLDDAPAHSDDVRRYAEHRLHVVPTDRRRALAERVATAAAGSFLYARYVLDDLLTDAERLEDPHRIQLPAGLDAHYREYLTRELARTDEAWEERYRPLLGLLAVARGAGLSPDVLSGAADMRRSRVVDALRRLGQYLEGPTPEGPLRIYHQSFRDFLLSDKELGVYPAEAERALTDYLLAVTPASPDGQRDWSRAAEYARAHLASHAGAATQLEPLLDDTGFIVAADPQPLLRALLGVPDARVGDAKRAFQHVAHLMADASPGERASYLELAAQRIGAQAFAARIAGRHPDRPWTTSWAHWRPGANHFLVGRHSAPMAAVEAVAVGELDRRQVIVSGGRDRTLRVWEFANELPVAAPFTGDDKPVVAIGELDGRSVIVSGGLDGTVRVWELADGTPLGEALTGHEGPVKAVKVGELDGRSVIVTGDLDGTVRVWELADGSPIGAPLTGHRPHAVNAIALGRLGDCSVAVSAGDDQTVRIWDLAGGAPVGEPLTAYHGCVQAVAVGELDGRPVIVSGGGGLCVWELDAGSPPDEPRVIRAGDVRALAVNERGGHPVIISAGYAGTLEMWDLASGAPVGAGLTGHEGPVNALDVGELDGRPVIVSGGEDGTVRVWEPAYDGPIDDVLIGHRAYLPGRYSIDAVAVGELDGRSVAVSGGEDANVQVWDLATGEPVGEPLIGHSSAVRAVAVGDFDGRPVIVSGGDGGALRAWDLADGSPIGDAIVYQGQITSVAVGELDGCPVTVLGGMDGALRLWELVATGSPRGAFLLGDHPSPISGVAVEELDGHPVIVSGGMDGTVRVWGLADGSPRGAPWTAHPAELSGIQAVAVGEVDGRRVIVSGGGDSTVRVWELADGSPIGAPLIGHRGWVNAVALGEVDGRPVIISGATDRTLRVWDFAGSELSVIDVESRVHALGVRDGTIVVGADAGILAIEVRLGSRMR